MSPAVLPDLSRISLLESVFSELFILRDGNAWPLITPASIGNITTQPHLRIERQQEKAIIMLTITGQALDAKGQTLPIRATFRLVFTFQVTQLAQELTQPNANQEVQLSQPMYLTLLSLAYSTARGMILSKTADTVVRGFVLPAVNVQALPQPL